VRYGNKEILADAGTALLAAIAAVKAASLQVLINLRGQEADEFVAEARDKVAAWLEGLPALEAELWDLLQKQIG
jgi:formiminotetrahydrofolate cyclodeaminase